MGTSNNLVEAIWVATTANAVAAELGRRSHDTWRCRIGRYAGNYRQAVAAKLRRMVE